MSNHLSAEERRALIDALCDTPQFASARERRVLVNHALGDYPAAARVLRWQEWDGSAMVVATELVQRLDGLEPIPSVAALGLLTQAIEPMVGGAHQQSLVAMRRRHAWGADAAPAGAETWNDDRTPGDLVRERIIGENTLRHVAYLQQALRAAGAVVRIDVHGFGSGTGFLIAPDLMLTNNHVIPDAAKAASAEITFFYEFALDGSVRDGVSVRIADQGLLLTDAKRDVSVLRLAQPPSLDHYPPLRPVLLEPREGRPDPRVAIIQHPGGGLKKISLQNNLVCYSDRERLQYYTSTQAGSSGSPVFDDDFNIVAIHCGAVRNAEWQHDSAARAPVDPKRIEELQFRNQGASMIAVVDWLREHQPGLLSDIRIQQD